MMSNTSTTTTSTPPVVLKEEGGIETVNNTMSSSSTSWPPMALVAFVGVVIFYLYISTHFSPKDRTVLNLKLLLLVIPVTLFCLVPRSYFLLRFPRLENDTGSLYRHGASPWGVALVLLLLYLLISYHSS